MIIIRLCTKPGTKYVESVIYLGSNNYCLFSFEIMFENWIHIGFLAKTRRKILNNWKQTLALSKYQSLTYPEQKRKYCQIKEFLVRINCDFCNLTRKYLCEKIKKDSQTGFVVKYVIESVTECMQAERSAVSLQASCNTACSTKHSGTKCQKSAKI